MRRCRGSPSPKLDALNFEYEVLKGVCPKPGGLRMVRSFQKRDKFDVGFLPHSAALFPTKRFNFCYRKPMFVFCQINFKCIEKPRGQVNWLRGLGGDCCSSFCKTTSCDLYESRTALFGCLSFSPLAIARRLATSKHIYFRMLLDFPFQSTPFGNRCLNPYPP
jgi:hypothetical protein